MALPAPSLIAEAVASLDLEGFTPAVGVVLGSGLGGFHRRIEAPRTIPHANIPHLPTPSVGGHAGRLHLGTVRGVHVACLEGRVHAYEGFSEDRVCFGVTLLAALGCRAVLLSNAAGGLRAELAAGDLMLITDHLNLTGMNPFTGPHDERVPRFLDVTRAYDPRLCTLAREAAEQTGIPLAEGVYAAVRGPSYETPAEVRMLASLGASAVGMSTALEVLALNGLGVKTAAISCITNAAAGLGEAPLDHEDVKVQAGRAAGRFEALFETWLGLIGEALAQP